MGGASSDHESHASGRVDLLLAGIAGSGIGHGRGLGMSDAPKLARPGSADAGVAPLAAVWLSPSASSEAHLVSGGEARLESQHRWCPAPSFLTQLGRPAVEHRADGINHGIRFTPLSAEVGSRATVLPSHRSAFTFRSFPDSLLPGVASRPPLRCRPALSVGAAPGQERMMTGRTARRERGDEVWAVGPHGVSPFQQGTAIAFFSGAVAFDALGLSRCSCVHPCFGSFTFSSWSLLVLPLAIQLYLSSCI